MEYTELIRIKKILDEGSEPITVNWDKAREELDDLLKYQVMNESLSLSNGVCPTCGRPM